MSLFAYINAEGKLNIQSDEATTTYALSHYLEQDNLPVRVFDEDFVLKPLQEATQGPEAPTQYTPPTPDNIVPPTPAPEARNGIRYDGPHMTYRTTAGEEVDLSDQHAVVKVLSALDQLRHGQQNRITDLIKQNQELRATPDPVVGEYVGNLESRIKQLEDKADYWRIKAEERGENLRDLGNTERFQRIRNEQLERAINKILDFDFPSISKEMHPVHQANEVIEEISRIKQNWVALDAENRKIEQEALEWRGRATHAESVNSGLRDRLYRIRGVYDQLQPSAIHEAMRRAILENTIREED